MSVGEKNNLVLIHGWGFDSRVWQPLLDPLRLNYELTLIDLPGFGERDKINKEFTLDSIIEAIKNDLPTTANYLGWSLGGLVAMKIAEKFPEKVEQLFLTSATPKFIENNEWPGVSTDFFDEFEEILKSNHKKMIANFAGLQCPVNMEYRKNIIQLRQLFTTADVQILLEGLSILKNIDFRKNLSKLKCKIKIILGSEDKLVPTKFIECFKQENINSSIIAGAAHAPFLTHREEFLACLV